MLDTVTLYQKGRNNSDFELNDNQFRKHSNERNVPDILYNTFYNDEGKKSIYVMNDLNRSYAKIQFSIPKLLYGNSLQNVNYEDTSKLETILNERLKGKFEGDFLNMEVSRLDITQNMEMKNDIPVYIHALNNAYAGDKRYKVVKYSDETLLISNNSRRFEFYDKVKEALHNKDITRSEAKEHGRILRFEVQHKKKQHIKTSFHKQYTFEEILKEGFFDTAKLFQVNSFDKMFCNAGNYEMFMQDIAMIEVVRQYNKRNMLKNFLLKKLTDETEYIHNFEHYEDLLKLSGMTRDGIRKALKEVQRILMLSKTKRSDIIEEIRNKLVA
jgi:hypothetical protein